MVDIITSVSLPVDEELQIKRNRLMPEMCSGTEK